MDAKVDMVRDAKMEKEEKERRMELEKEKTKEKEDIEGLYLHEKIYWRMKEMKNKLKTRFQNFIVKSK